MKYILTGGRINGELLNEKIAQEQLHEYSIIDLEDFIDELIRWISEARESKTLMMQDLRMLMNVNEDYILTSNSTNSYLYPGESGFEDVCQEILDLNNNLKQ